MAAVCLQEQFSPDIFKSERSADHFVEDWEICTYSESSASLKLHHVTAGRQCLHLMVQKSSASMLTSNNCTAPLQWLMGFVQRRPGIAAGLQLSAKVLQKRILEDSMARGDLQMHTLR